MPAEPRRGRPAAREALALVGGGLAVRACRAVEHPVAGWVDGLHLGVFLLALANLVHAAWIYADPGGVWWLAASAGLAVALLRGRALVALPFAAALIYHLHRTYLGAVGLDGWWPASGPAYATSHQWEQYLPFWFIMAALPVLAALSLRRSVRLRARSGLWLAPVVAAAAYGAGTSLILADPAVVSRVWTGVEMAAAVVLLAAGAAVAAATGSRRWALAAVVAVLRPSSPRPNTSPTRCARSTSLRWPG